MIPEARLHEVSLGLRAHLTSKLPASVIVKEDSEIHRSIARLFDAGHDVQQLASLLSLDVPLALPTGEEYLAGYGTTLGDVIALPRAWHAPARAVTRLVVEPHEWQHVRQHREGVDAGWWPRSTSHSVLWLAGHLGGDEGAEYCGKIEADGYAVSEAVARWLGLAPRGFEPVSAELRAHYALAAPGVDVAEGLLRSHWATLDAGGTPPAWAAREALGWLEANAADLRGHACPRPGCDGKGCPW